MVTTTSGTLVASQSDNGSNGRYGLKAKLAIGVAVLGCAVTLTFGGLRAGDAARPAEHTSPLVSPAQTNGARSYEQVRFLEDNVELPSAGATLLFTPDPFTYREDRRVSLPTGAAPALDREAIYLIEQNQLPELTFPAAPAGMGPQEYLPGEGPAAEDGNPPVPVFGPQP
jgi:hypothetical protein